MLDTEEQFSVTGVSHPSLTPALSTITEGAKYLLIFSYLSIIRHPASGADHSLKSRRLEAHSSTLVC